MKCLYQGKIYPSVVDLVTEVEPMFITWTDDQIEDFCTNVVLNHDKRSVREILGDR